MENRCPEKRGEYQEEFRNTVQSCIRRYEFGTPTVAIVNNKVYSLLARNSLLNEPQSFGDLHNRARLINDEDLSIGVYRLRKLSKRQRAKLSEQIKGNKHPIILCKRGALGFKKLDISNLEKFAGEFAQT